MKDVYPFPSLLCIHFTAQIAAFLSSQSFLPLPLSHLSLSYISEKGEVPPGYQPTLTLQVTAGLGTASPIEASQDSPVKGRISTLETSKMPGKFHFYLPGVFHLELGAAIYLGSPTLNLGSSLLSPHTHPLYILRRFSFLAETPFLA